jgi:hypothetical protein
VGKPKGCFPTFVDGIPCKHANVDKCTSLRVIRTKIFEAIANSVGNFIFYDDQALRWSNKRLAWVLVEIDLDKGLPDEIEIYIGDTYICQAVDYWREPFCCHNCWQPGHLKSKCLTFQEQRNTTMHSGATADHVVQSLPDHFDKGTFLGKMQLFFPSFFSKLSSEEFEYLRSNENWVLEIFGDFWDILMKKFVDLDVGSGIGPKGLGVVNDPLFPPIASKPVSTPGCVSLNEDTGNKVDICLNTKNGPGHHGVGPICISPSPVETECPTDPSGGDCNPVETLPICPPSLSVTSVDALSPSPLPISNNFQKPSSIIDRTNVTLRKNPHPRLPKKTPGEIEGGMDVDWIEGPC